MLNSNISHCYVCVTCNGKLGKKSVFKLIYPWNAYDSIAICQKKPTYTVAKSCLCSSTGYLQLSSKVHWTLPRKARIYQGFSNLDLWGSVQKLLIETAKWKNICFRQAYVNTSFKQSNSERDAESQLQLQCRSDHRRITFIHSANCTSCTQVQIPAAELKCTMLLIRNWDHLEMLRMKQAFICLHQAFFRELLWKLQSDRK